MTYLVWTSQSLLMYFYVYLKYLFFFLLWIKLTVQFKLIFLRSETRITELKNLLVLVWNKRLQDVELVWTLKASRFPNPTISSVLKRLDKKWEKKIVKREWIVLNIANGKYKYYFAAPLQTYKRCRWKLCGTGRRFRPN